MSDERIGRIIFSTLAILVAFRILFILYSVLPILATIIEDLFERCIAPDTATGIGCDNMTCLIVQFS